MLFSTGSVLNETKKIVKLSIVSFFLQAWDEDKFLTPV